MMFFSWKGTNGARTIMVKQPIVCSALLAHIINNRKLFSTLLLRKEPYTNISNKFWSFSTSKHLVLFSAVTFISLTVIQFFRETENEYRTTPVSETIPIERISTAPVGRMTRVTLPRGLIFRKFGDASPRPEIRRKGGRNKPIVAAVPGTKVISESWKTIVVNKARNKRRPARNKKVPTTQCESNKTALRYQRWMGAAGHPRNITKQIAVLFLH